MGSISFGQVAECNEHKNQQTREKSVSSATMATISLIKEAILALKERTGSSVVAINKYLETEKKVR